MIFIINLIKEKNMRLLKYALALLFLVSNPIQLSAMDKSDGMEEIKKKKKKGKKLKGKAGKGKKGGWGKWKSKWKKKKAEK
jgi:hypothetical protein